MNDIMCCATCGGALKIVCDVHGTEFVPDRRMALAPEPPPTPHRKSSAIRRGDVLVTPGSKRARLFDALSTDPAHASTVKDVARATGRDVRHVGVDLAILAREGRILRVGRGTYARRVA